MKNQNFSVRKLARCGMVAALYVVLCMALQPFSYVYYGVRKTVDLLHRDGAAIDCREYDAAAGCTQIDRDETVCRHILGSFRFALQNYPIISSLCHRG